MSHICLHNGTILTGTTKFAHGAVLLYNNKIIDIFNEYRFSKKVLPKDTKTIDVKGSYIIPGLIDTHIHGIGGFGTDDMKKESILEMAKLLPKYGVTSFCPTMYPAPIDIMNDTLSEIVEAIEIIAAQRNRGIYHGANIAGIHIEGPFISTKRLGVHRPEAAHVPDMDVLQQFIKLSKGHLRNMTVAPELKGMHEIAIYAISHNIVLQAGHTNAEYENIIEGMQVGITHATHFFNAMSRLHHRNPGTVGAILIHPEMSCEIIADGIHVNPHLISLLIRNKPIENLVLITDSIRPTKQVAERLYANKEEVYLKDEVFVRKEDDVIAGSALTMLKGIQNLVTWDVPLEHAIMMASHNPAKIINIPKRGQIIPGYTADIVVLSKSLEIEYTIIEGELWNIDIDESNHSMV